MSNFINIEVNYFCRRAAAITDANVYCHNLHWHNDASKIQTAHVTIK